MRGVRADLRTGPADAVGQSDRRRDHPDVADRRGFRGRTRGGGPAAKPLLSTAAASFVVVEIVLGLVGGFSAVTLYVTFTFFGSSAIVLVLATALIGVLVGAEVPLLMTLLQSGRSDTDAESTGKVLANLNAADYAGALVGGLLWPFVLLPIAGMIRGAAITGIINLVAAAVVALILLRWQLSLRTRVCSPSWRCSSPPRASRCCWCAPTASRSRRGNGSTPTRWSPRKGRSTRRSWSPSAGETCACSSTATSSSPASTNIGTPNRWCTPRWPTTRNGC